MHLPSRTRYTPVAERRATAEAKASAVIRGGSAARAHVRSVHEEVARYFALEDEGSELRSIASMAVLGDARWTAVLTVPIPEQEALLIRLERSGELPDGYRGAGESAIFSMPMVEAEAVFSLLNGIFAQARRDGVLRGT
jgi:hypothetical protein